MVKDKSPWDGPNLRTLGYFALQVTENPNSATGTKKESILSKQEVWRQRHDQASSLCWVNPVASLRTQVHFVFLLCPLHVGLTLQLPALLTARWRRQPQRSHPSIASKGRKGTISSKTNRPLPEAPQNFPFTSHGL